MSSSALPLFFRALLIRPRGTGVQGGRDPGRGDDRDVAGLGAQHDRAACGLGDADVAPGGADLGGAAEAADLDVAVDRGEADARGFVDFDLVVGAVEGEVAQAADAPEFAGGGLGLEVGAGGQLDGDLHGSGGAEQLVGGLGGVDAQDAVGVGDGGLLGAWTSRLLAGLVGRISTVASVRSAAMSWRRPAGMSRTVVIGVGVANFCMVCSCAFVVSDSGNATLHSTFKATCRCGVIGIYAGEDDEIVAMALKRNATTIPTRVAMD